MEKVRDDHANQKRVLLDENGLDPDVRRRILSYGAPNRRRSGSAKDAGVKDGRRRDDKPERQSDDDSQPD